MKLLAIAVLVFFLIAPTIAQTEEARGQDSLKGIKDIIVSVQTVGADTVPNLQEELVEASVEVALRNAGITVVSTDASPHTGPFYNRLILQINIVAVTNADLPYAGYSVTLWGEQLGLVQRANTANVVTTKTMLLCTTWQDGETGIVGKANLSQIKDVMDAEVTIFVNDYLNANPKSSANIPLKRPVIAAR